MIYRCTSPFSVRVNGVPRVVAAGELVADNDPVFKGRAKHFEPVQTYVDRVAEKHVDRVMHVEQATAAPGEARKLTTPRRKKTAAKQDKPEETKEDAL